MGMFLGAVVAGGTYMLAVRRVYRSNRLSRKKKIALYLALVPLAGLVFVGVALAVFLLSVN